MKQLKIIFTLIFIINFNSGFSQSISWFGGISIKSDTDLDKGGFGFNFGGGVNSKDEISKYFSIGIQSSFDYYIGDRNNESNFVNTSIPHSDYTESIQNNFDINVYAVTYINPIKTISIYAGGGVNFLDGLKVRHSNVTGLDWNGGNTMKILPTFISGLRIYPSVKSYFFSFEINKDKYNFTYLLRMGLTSDLN